MSSGSGLTKEQKKVILATNIGNILEWYDIYAFAYLSPSIAKVFFPFQSSLHALFSSFLVFGIGCLTRILGAFFFGSLGDHKKGRKSTFLISIIITTSATLLIGCLPSFAVAGILAPICLFILRIIQSFGTAGEYPGAICFLYENSHVANSRFMTSWVGVGNQIGAIIGIIEIFVMDKLMSQDFLLSWGWRLSFWYGGIIGLIGIWVRSYLRETPLYELIKKQERVDAESEIGIARNHSKPIFLGVAYGALNASTFYLLGTYLPTYFQEITKISSDNQFFITLIVMILTTVLLPVFGRIGDKVSNRFLLVVSALLIIVCMYPLCLSLREKNWILLGSVSFVSLLSITCISALLGYRLAHLFQTSIRFTGVGLSWNITDGCIGSFSPAIAILLFELTGNESSFCWFVLITAFVSLIAYWRVKD